MLLAPWKAENPVTAHCTKLNASVVSFWPWRPGRLLDSQLLFFCPSQKVSRRWQEWMMLSPARSIAGRQVTFPVLTACGKCHLCWGRLVSIHPSWSCSHKHTHRLICTWIKLTDKTDDHHRCFLPRTEQWWITGVEHQARQENRPSVFRTYLRMCWNEYL